MEKINGCKKDDLIIVQSTDDIEKVFNLIKDEKNFIFQYQFEGKTRSELILTEGMLSLLKTGELSIISEN